LVLDGFEVVPVFKPSHFKIETFKWAGASRIKQVYGSYLVLLIAFKVVPGFQGVTTASSGEGSSRADRIMAGIWC
jgi:hypothetical protein